MYVSLSCDLGADAWAGSWFGLVLVVKVEVEGSWASFAVEVVVEVDSTTTSVFD